MNANIIFTKSILIKLKLALATTALGLAATLTASATLMNFDSGKITSDGFGNIGDDGNITLTNGSLFTRHDSTYTFALGPNWSNPGIQLSAFHGQANSCGIFQVSPQYVSLDVLLGTNTAGGTYYSAVYIDNTGRVAINGGPNITSGLYLNAVGTDDLVDGSGDGLHLDGSGNISFDGTASFAGGAATITPDSFGNGGTTLMLQASDNGTPMYLHVDSSGTATWTTTP